MTKRRNTTSSTVCEGEVRTAFLCRLLLATVPLPQRGRLAHLRCAEKTCPPRPALFAQNPSVSVGDDAHGVPFYPDSI